MRVGHSLKKSLLAAARRQGRPESEVVREALEEYVARH
ncbi:ribbon-helix-helix protein, CopG family [Saccharopolyspora mangrovi]